MQAVSTLRQLSDLIATAVTTLENLYRAAGQPLPSLDVPFDPADPAEALRDEPVVAEAITHIVAAAGQLTATVQNPNTIAIQAIHSFQLPSCLRAASELNAVEILREAGEKGASAETIASLNNVRADLVARTLRLLATHHIFREVEPGVFANNRNSSTLDKGKTVDELYAKPEDRLNSAKCGVSAFIEFIGDECFKASSFFADTLLQSQGQMPVVPLHRAFNLDASENMFSWLDKDPFRVARFARAMQGTVISNKFASGQGFAWGELPHGSVIIDVGAGTGAHAMDIAKANGEAGLEFVIQDRAVMAQKASEHWNEHFPSYVQRGLVKFQAHDFFTPQPIPNASVFVLRHILHNWPDAKSQQILAHLRAAAIPGKTQLVIIDRIVRTASPLESADPTVRAIPGATSPAAPAPLLPNWGMARATLYYSDLNMHNLLGAPERTIDAFVSLLRGGGWEVVRVYGESTAGAEAQSSYIVAKPI